MSRLSLVAALLAAPAFAAGLEPAAQRYAVIVGSNAPVQERPGLRYSHRDAKSFAQVLLDVGRFERENVQVLLDPTPKRVLGSLDDAIAQAKAGGGKAMLVFYYSGHADGHSLFPNGQPLALTELKTRLTDEGLDLRVGIIDGCSGGGWTQAKGLKPAEPFAVGLPQLESEGTVLLSSSSGIEDAHEAEVLQGSFFTHHLVAGLRGAADQSGDRLVTLAEAFSYANAMTIRDTAQVAKQPQHPSFDMRLRGRQDVVLTALESSASSLTLIQQFGPLQVVALATGQLIAESPEGSLQMTLAIPAGAYVVRRVDSDGVVSKKIVVEPMSSEAVEERALMPTDAQMVASKGVVVTAYAELPPQFEVGAAGGARTNDGENPGATVEGAFTWRVARNLSWRVLRAQVNMPSGHFERNPLSGATLHPQQAFRVGTDFVLTFFRSLQAAKGFRFESQLLVGPSIAGLYRSVGINGTADRGVGIGPSLELAADFRLPYLPDVHLRFAVGGDVLFALMRNAGMQGAMRGSIGLAWRFGSTD